MSEARNQFSRRALLGAGAGIAASTVIGARGSATASGAEAQAAAGTVLKRSLLPPERIGLQLYSLRDSVAELGFAKVLETVAEIGFKQVEFAGYTQGTGPITVKELRALMDANGLKAAGSHVSPSDDASMKAILDDAAVLGIPNVGLSLLLPSGAPTVSGWQAAAEQHNHWGQMAKERGVRWYLHNHFQEWLPTLDDTSRRGMDVLLAETDPALVDFQLDIFWAYVGRAQSGLTPFDPLKDYAIPQRDRFKLFHVKDGQAMTAQISDVGEGEIDFQTFFVELFKQAPDQPSRHMYLWENDDAANHPRGPLAAARSSFVNMRYGLFVPAAPADADGGFVASVLKTAFTRDKRGRRVLRVTLELSADADVSAKLTRDGKRLARASRHVAEGRRRFDVVLPRSVTGGIARLDLKLSNGAGVSLALRDTVRIPSARKAR